MAGLLTGCLGSGFGGVTPPAPTHANLKGAGQQIVDDTKTVWETFQDMANSDWQRIASNFESEVASQIGLMEQPIGFSLETIYIAFMDRLFFFEPGTYSLAQIKEGTDIEDHLHTGEWTVEVHDNNGNLLGTLHYSRVIQDNTDIFTYRIVWQGDQNLDYQGKLTYSTAILDILYSFC
ncbi:MAG: hypothetical protein ACUVRM_07110 [Bacillota bacterium]